MNHKNSPIEVDNSEIRIRVVNKKERQDPYELFNAMGSYMEAIQKFNALIVHSVDPNADYSFKFEKVEYSSIVSVVKEWTSNLNNLFTSAVNSTAMNEIQSVLSNNDVTKASEIYDLCSSLEDRIKM